MNLKGVELYLLARTPLTLMWDHERCSDSLFQRLGIWRFNTKFNVQRSTFNGGSFKSFGIKLQLAEYGLTR
jgi:hypothetical protein